MKLETLMVDIKTAWLDFPGYEGFEVKVANLSRKELQALRKRCIKTRFDRKTHQAVEEIDDDKFASVNKNPNVVAIFGNIIPEPLAMP